MKFKRGALFGVGVETDFDLPLQDLLTDPLIHIRSGHVALPDQPPDFQDDQVRIFRQAEGKVVLLFAGTAVSICPHEVVIDTKRALDADLLVFFAWPLLLSLRGRESLHGSVVERDGKGLAVVGAPGSGKSTAALRLIELGFRLVADDLVVLDEELRAQPGPPFIRLRSDQVSVYDGEWDAGGKLRYRPPACAEPVPLGRIIVLDDEFGEPLRVTGARAADLLVRNVASGYLVQPQQGLNRFEFAAEIARRIPMMGAKPRSLNRPDLERLTGSADFWQ